MLNYVKAISFCKARPCYADVKLSVYPMYKTNNLKVLLKTFVITLNTCTSK